MEDLLASCSISTNIKTKHLRLTEDGDQNYWLILSVLQYKNKNKSREELNERKAINCCDSIVLNGPVFFFFFFGIKIDQFFFFFFF